MFDVGFWELVLIFGVGLMLLGPERMPRVAAQIGRWIGRARRTASQLRRQLEQELQMDELNRQRRRKPPAPPPKPDASPPADEQAEGESTQAGSETGTAAPDAETDGTAAEAEHMEVESAGDPWPPQSQAAVSGEENEIRGTESAGSEARQETARDS